MAGPSPTPAQLRLNRDFRLLLMGQSASALGDAVMMTAMPLVVLSLTGSGALMGVVGALELIPALLISLPAGALADRIDKRRLLAWSDAGRAVLTAVIPAAIWLDASAITVILVMAAPISALRILFESALTSAVPTMVGRENLGRAMGVLESVLTVPFIVGPALAGLLLVAVGPAWTIAVNAVSFAVSAVSLLFLRKRLVVERTEPSRLAGDIKAGLRFVAGHEGLRTLIGYWAAMSAVTAGILPALGYYLTVDRSMGAEVFGFVGSAWSAGYLLGSIAAVRLGNRALGLRLLGSGAALGVALLALSFSASPVAVVAAGALVGLALAVQLIAAASLRSLLTPDELLGRVGSTARMVTLGLQPLGMIGAGFVIEAASGQFALLLMGVLMLALAVLFAVPRTLRVGVATLR